MPRRSARRSARRCSAAIPAGAHAALGGFQAAVIDKVDGVIENRRPDAKNAQYARIIKEGDVLLNSLQKLSRTAL